MTQSSTQDASNCKPYFKINGRYWDNPKYGRLPIRKRCEKLRANLAKVIGVLYVQHKSHLRKLPKALREEFLKLKDWQGIFLFGSVGCGKTFAMSAFGRYFALKGKKVIFTTYSDLCLEIRKIYTCSDSELNVIQKYRDADKLFIDDLGTAVSVGNQESDFAVRVLYDVVDWRIKNLKATFFTSNKSPEEIASSFDERIASRLHQACKIIPVAGKDKRKS
jgi:DNA replication protein DnaC